MISGPSTDTTKKRLAPGFVVTEPATKMNPWLKEWASQFPVTQEGISNGVNAITTNGEVFVPKLGVEAAGDGSFELGVMRLREMNNKPKEGGHASIDRLIAMSTLQGLKPMTMGGEITPNYSGGGLTGYENGGETQIDPRIMAKRIRGDVYSRSGLYDVEYDKEGVMRGARLRKELEGQPGYENFSDMVDNVGATVIQAEKDYYSDRGGYPVVGTSSTDPLVRAILKGEGYLDEARQQGDLVGYENGDTTFEDAVIAARTPFHNLKPNPDTGMYDIESIAGVAGDSGRNYYIGRGSAESPSAAAQAAHLMALKNSMSGEPMDIDPSDVGSYFKPKKKGLMGLLGFQEGGLSKLLSMITPKGRRQRSYEEMVPQDMRNAERVYTYPASGNNTDTLLEFENPDVKEIEAINRLVKEGDRADAFNKLLYGIVPQALGEQGTVAKRQGGLINYQDGGMIGPPVPPEMMGQAMNQQLDDSIDMRMANPQVGGALGVMRQESEEIEAAMKDNIARNARLALQKMKLDSIMKMKPQERYIPDSLITNPQSLDIRDYEGVPSSNDFLRLFQNMDRSKGVRIPRPSTLR